MGIDVADLLPVSALVDERALDTPGGRLQIWRTPSLLVVRLVGDVTDEGSVTWRGAVDGHVAKQGWAPLMILDVHEALAINSMGMRFKSAGWARMVLEHIEQGVIFTGKNHRSSFVIRTILRFAGMPNVILLGDEVVYRAAVERYKNGAALVDVPVRKPKAQRA